jgi:hypothetical protein
MFLTIDDGVYVFTEDDPRQNGFQGNVVENVAFATYPPQNETTNWLLDRTPVFAYLGKWSETEYCAFSTMQQLTEQKAQFIASEHRPCRSWSDWLQIKSPNL